MSDSENIEKNFETKKKSKLGLIITCLVLAIAIIAGTCAYFIINSQPKNILKKYVSKLEMKEAEKFENAKLNMNISAKINTNDSQIQSVADEISKCKFKFGSQIDVKNKVEIVDLGFDYDNQNVVDGKIVYKDSLYIYLNELFDKYIELDMDEEGKESIENLFKEFGKEDLMSNSKEIVDVTKNFLNDKINSIEKIESENTKLNINGKEKKVKKTTISITMKQFAEYFADYCGKLSESKAYASDMDTKNVLKTVAEAIKSVEFNEKDAMKLSLYTEGLNNDFVCFEIEIFIEELNMNVKLQLLKQDKNTYKYTISMNGQGANVDAITGTIKIEEEISNKKQDKGKITVTAEVAEMLTKGLKINGEISIEYNVQVNSGIDEVNVENSVKGEELSEEELNTILEKLQQKPMIGDLITSIMNTNVYEGI